MKEMIDFFYNKRFQPLTFRKPFSYEYKCKLYDNLNKTLELLITTNSTACK